MSDYEPGRLISDVLDVVRLKAAEKSIDLELRIAPDLPRLLLGDDRGLRQVLVNLLSNAVKYTHRGFVRLTASKEAVSDGEISLSFSVEDSGIGISREDQDKLFMDFVQLSRDKFYHHVEGTGLGLAIAQGMARLMGGEITVSSVLGRGSTFTATFRQVIIDPKPMALEDGQIPKAAPQERVASFVAPGVRESLLSQGFDDYISKPIDSLELDHLLDKWVQPGSRLSISKGEGSNKEGSEMSLVVPLLASAGIDVGLGVSRCGGSLEIYEKILKAFLKDAERLDPLLDSSNPVPDLIIHVHVLKSATANIGATELSRTAAEIEANLKAGLKDDIENGRVYSLRRELRRVSEVA
jgi:HPt (histidine-containing phosphotransfer) domain-containing protein/anti-sigma regulatory factor (Ser/Thr protein kinase)